MSNYDRPAARPAGATPAGGKPNRRKWLVPLLIALVVLIALLLLLSRCGNNNKSDSSAYTSPTSTGTVAPASTDTGASAATPSDSGQPSPDAGGEGTVTANGDDLLSAQTSISQGGHDGQQAVGHAVKVQSVPADEGFWVGTSTTDRLWVQLSGTHGESDYAVKKDDAIDFTGTVKPASKSFASSVGLTTSEGADQLTRQGHYISVPSSSVKLFH